MIFDDITWGLIITANLQTPSGSCTACVRILTESGTGYHFMTWSDHTQIAVGVQYPVGSSFTDGTSWNSNFAPESKIKILSFHLIQDWSLKKIALICAKIKKKKNERSKRVSCLGDEYDGYYEGITVFHDKRNRSQPMKSIPRMLKSNYQRSGNQAHSARRSNAPRQSSTSKNGRHRLAKLASAFSNHFP